MHSDELERDKFIRLSESDPLYGWRSAWDREQWIVDNVRNLLTAPEGYDWRDFLQRALDVYDYPEVKK